MRIEALELFKDGKDIYEKGDQRSVSKEDGEYFCSLGWAKDLDGKVKTGVRQKNGETRLDVRNAVHKQEVTRG